ncbi:putative MFS family arabinose efflux permease [Streptomyces sp. 2333.5]|uniref:MFS transporter n=1 Tax=unclassified Streptomyces TaxID=2593676 RepID=UPI0008975EA4|nr:MULTISPECIES: MFS transporter [unclassified Streptomyces]PJI99818.1 putative MFS family arabinose efflux permease [Streptomyces sp. 2333.5]SEC42905.1 Predicted arabinose efflux permease, MFS family [Streptomyces sp. 2112.2]
MSQPMSGVKDLMRVPGLPQLFLWSMLGRLNVSALPIALSLMLVRWSNSYVVVGLVGCALTLGQGAAGPLRGRAADRGSTGRLLVITGVGYTTGLAVIVTLAARAPASSWPVVVVVALVTGLSAVPVSQISRAVWPKIVGSELTSALYTAEATASEVITTIGPLLAALVIAVAGPYWAVGVTALLALVSALVFAAALGRVGLGGEPLPQRGERLATRSLLTEGPFVRVVAISMLVTAAIFAVNLSVVAWTQNIGRPALAGVLTACWTTGSLAGGFALSTFARGLPRALRVAGMAAGMAALAVLLPPVLGTVPLWLIVVVLFLGGTAIAPTLAATYEQIAEASPEDRRAEAFGWMATATAGGGALSAVLTGALLDFSGPALPVAAGAALVVAALVLTVFGRKPRAPSAETVEEVTA